MEKNSKSVFFILDFQIDAGFSFSTAVAHRMMRNGAASVSISETLKSSNVDLKLNYKFKKIGIMLESLQITYTPNYSYENTERYLISARFCLLDLDYEKLKKSISEDALIKSSLPKDIHLAIFLQDCFGSQSEYLMNEIISHIELSGFYARQVPATFNLYMSYDGRGKIFRVCQRGSDNRHSGQNPIHPLQLRSKSIISNHEELIPIPDNIKKHFKKGIHYQFLGFYDESFLCFYKIIESIFKDNEFSKKLTEKIFNSQSTPVVGAVKSSNQKTMMLFIYQFHNILHPGNSSDENLKLMNNMISASDIRNSIAHSSDNSAESERILPFLISLAKFMIANKCKNSRS